MSRNAGRRAGLKPYFNDFVVHEDHAFGFDGSILSCIDITHGERKWKGGRYGQMLVAESDLLLALAEDDELALVNTATDRKTAFKHPVRELLTARFHERA